MLSKAPTISTARIRAEREFMRVTGRTDRRQHIVVVERRKRRKAFVRPAA